MIVAGLMSGTSLDGIDVAIVDISGEGWEKKLRTLAHASFPYPPSVRRALLAVSNTETHTAQIGLLHFLLPELYAKAVRNLCSRARIPLKNLELVGCHGQTILHIGAPARFLRHRVRCTLQIGDGSALAERLGVPVVSDFRARDIAAGGQGAPLAPYVDYLLLRDARLGRVALNIGGIANITAIPAGARPGKVIAFDTGPGNMVMDALVAEYTRGARRYDRDGAIARRGKRSRWLLRILLRDPFYRRPPPKSAGREEFGGEFANHLVNTRLPLEDLIATAAALTASTIALGIRREVMPRMKVHEVVASGGGVHNSYVMELLAEQLPEVLIRRSSDFGMDVDAKEAIAFAVLAHETWKNQPGNLPSATGARRPVILGKISPGPARRGR
ncbi:MAG: anhydro-N-acetylmuramic acid kinase [Acidobacteria bacterium]|nr:anhydro-N-acetylmuramic acid kinase [Acidobacteriota bacterium]